MEMISQYFNQGFSFIVPLIVLLGVLIFVHELGHFSVAKYFGVRVEVFSLGFGRKLLKKTVGDTTYCLSAIPFGGYVKMFGDDPSTPVPVEEQKYSFTHQPVLPRIAIVLAGPIMNALFAVLLFSIIAGVGEEALRSKLGDISPASQAYSFGFRSGDLINKVNEKSVDRWDQVKKAIEENANKNLTFEVSRGTEKLNIAASTKLAANKNVLSTKDTVGEIEGLTYLVKAPAIGVTSNKVAAYETGLRTGDVITKIDDTEINSWEELSTKIKAGSKLEVQRADLKKPLYFSVPTTATMANNNDKFAEKFGIESSELYLSSIVAKSGAEAAGIQVGDKLVSINGAKLERWDNVVKTVQSYKAENNALKVEVSRNGELKQFEVKPQIVSQADAGGMEQKNYALGVVTGLVLASPHTFLAKEASVGKMLVKGFDDTVRWTELTVLSFVKLAQRKVSAKSIGGPLMIGKLASETWKVGLSPFLKIMSIISINLFVLNLLPIPVLDGGHFLFFTIELIKGSPLSLRKLEIMQQVGMALLFALMIFSMFNDIVRIFSS